MDNGPTSDGRDNPTANSNAARRTSPGRNSGNDAGDPQAGAARGRPASPARQSQAAAWDELDLSNFGDNSFFTRTSVDRALQSSISGSQRNRVEDRRGGEADSLQKSHRAIDTKRGSQAKDDESTQSSVASDVLHGAKFPLRMAAVVDRPSSAPLVQQTSPAAGRSQLLPGDVNSTQSSVTQDLPRGPLRNLPAAPRVDRPDHDERKSAPVPEPGLQKQGQRRDTGRVPEEISIPVPSKRASRAGVDNAEHDESKPAPKPARAAPKPDLLMDDSSSESPLEQQPKRRRRIPAAARNRPAQSNADGWLTSGRARQANPTEAEAALQNQFDIIAGVPRAAAPSSPLPEGPKRAFVIRDLANRKEGDSFSLEYLSNFLDRKAGRPPVPKVIHVPDNPGRPSAASVSTLSQISINTDAGAAKAAPPARQASQSAKPDGSRNQPWPVDDRSTQSSVTQDLPDVSARNAPRQASTVGRTQRPVEQSRLSMNSRDGRSQSLLGDNSSKQSSVTQDLPFVPARNASQQPSTVGHTEPPVEQSRPSKNSRDGRSQSLLGDNSSTQSSVTQDLPFVPAHNASQQPSTVGRSSNRGEEIVPSPGTSRDGGSRSSRSTGGSSPLFGAQRQDYDIYFRDGQSQPNPGERAVEQVRAPGNPQEGRSQSLLRDDSSTQSSVTQEPAPKRPRFDDRDRTRGNGR